MPISTPTPYELGLDRLVNLESAADFIGKPALQRIKMAGVSRRQVGLEIDGAPFIGPNTTLWPVEVNGAVIGKVTSAIHSPRLKQNIALAMVAVDHAALGTVVQLVTDRGRLTATVVERTFYDPKKTLGVQSRHLVDRVEDESIRL